jgi:hypothetical protein
MFICICCSDTQQTHPITSSQCLIDTQKNANNNNDNHTRSSTNTNDNESCSPPTHSNEHSQQQTADTANPSIIHPLSPVRLFDDINDDDFLNLSPIKQQTQNPKPTTHAPPLCELPDTLSQLLRQPK